MLDMHCPHHPVRHADYDHDQPEVSISSECRPDRYSHERHGEETVIFQLLVKIDAEVAAID